MTEIPPRRSRVKEGLMLTDEQIIRRLGLPLEDGKRALAFLDRDRSKGFPPKQYLWGNRRYWPAVEKWLEQTSGILQNERKSA